MAAPPATFSSSNPPSLSDFIPPKQLSYHNFQKQEEHPCTLAHYNKNFIPSCKLAMTSEYQKWAIGAAFTNKDTLPKEKDP